MTTKTLDTLDKVIEDNKDTFAIDTFKQIMKNWGINFAKIPEKEKMKTLTDILGMAGIQLSSTPQGGLALKILEGRRRDNDVQERIRFSQAYNLAVEIVSARSAQKTADGDILKNDIETWQKYFHKKLGESIDDKEIKI